MKNKPKAWRRKANQDKTRFDLLTEALSNNDYSAMLGYAKRGLGRIRVGKTTRDTIITFLAHPSHLVSGLLIRAGIAKAA